MGGGTQSGYGYRVIASVAFAVLSTIAAAAALSATATALVATEPAVSMADPVVQRGRELRAEIDSTFRRLQATKAIRSSINGGNDVSALVRDYIPVDTPLQDAQSMLQAAGCQPGRALDGQVFEWTDLGGGTFDFFGNAFGVYLSVATIDGKATVRAVDAKIFRKYVPNADRR